MTLEGERSVITIFFQSHLLRTAFLAMYIQEAVVAFGCSSDLQRRATGFEQAKDIAMKCRSMRLLGSSALHLAYIAAGRLDGFLEEGLKPWDAAAG